MPQAISTDVLICGAGAAGLTLAIDLARRGVAFRLIDKAERPFPGSRGKGIQPRSLEVFEDLGVVDQMLAIGGPYPVTRTYREGGFDDEVFIERRAATPAEPYVQPLMLPQNLTEGVLRERLAEFGHQPEYGRELMSFEQDGDGVQVRIGGAAGEQATRVRYLVGADGGGSFVRRALEIGFPGQTLPVRALVADLVLEGLSRDAWHRWPASSAGQISLCPLAGTALFQLQCSLPLDGDPDLSDDGLARLIAERTGRDDLVLRSVLWRSPYSMNARLADRYQAGRVLLAGDAAHVHPPTGGQGLNTSVQDAYNLGWKLAAVLAGAPMALLDSYETERRPIAAGVLGLSTGLLRAAQERGDMRRGRENHQLELGYEGSALSLDLRGRPAGLKAGDRAPDAPCRDAAGRATRLFELFKGPHWTLLSYETDRETLTGPVASLQAFSVGAQGDVGDPDGHIRQAYDLAPGDWVLVRPDGYVGATGASAGAAALAGYLESVGLKAA